jgi:activator of 2-hydroxyglutaryl-CoA dehydratase
MRKALEEVMKVKLAEPRHDPQLAGALGAAIIAQDMLAKKKLKVIA